MAKKKKKTEDIEENKKKAKKVKIPRAVKLGLFLLLATSPFLLAAGLLAFFLVKATADRLQNKREESIIRQAIAQKDRLISELRLEREALRAETSQASSVAPTIPDEISISAEENMSQISEMDFSAEPSVDFDDGQEEATVDVDENAASTAEQFEDAEENNETITQGDDAQEEATVDVDENATTPVAQFEDAEEDTESITQGDDVQEEATISVDENAATPVAQFEDAEEDTQSIEQTEEFQPAATLTDDQGVALEEEDNLSVAESEYSETTTIEEDPGLDTPEVIQTGPNASLEESYDETLANYFDNEDGLSEASTEIGDQESVGSTLNGSAIIEAYDASLDLTDTESLAYSSDTDIEGNELALSEENASQTQELNDNVSMPQTLEGMIINTENNLKENTINQGYEADDELSVASSLDSVVPGENYPSEDIDGPPKEEEADLLNTANNANDNSLVKTEDSQKDLNKSNSLGSFTSATTDETLSSSNRSSIEATQTASASQGLGVALSEGKMVAFMTAQPTEKAKEYKERNDGAELSLKRKPAVNAENANKRRKMSSGI